MGRFSRVTITAAFSVCLVLGSGCASGGSVSNEEEMIESEVTSSPSADVFPVDLKVISYEPQNVIASLAEQGIRGDGACAIAVESVIQKGGNLVELTWAGSASSSKKSEQRLSASPGNGDSFPCTIEAVFGEVPSDALQYTARQRGSMSETQKILGPIVKTVSAEQVVGDGYQIVLVSEEN